MACVVLPSETARLVYGYLVKEKLDNIAFQFLENSPYLTDCCHIVKSGFHFNTKFLCKELHELLQEYSTIHNLVNKKIGLLSKSSPLYKRIKLQCESLSEILDLILFWKYNITKTDESMTVPSKRKLSNLIENKTDRAKEPAVNHNDNLSVNESTCNEFIDIETVKSDQIRQENEVQVFEDVQSNFNNKFPVDNNYKDSEKDIHVNCVIENPAEDEMRFSVTSDTTEKFDEIENQSKMEDIPKCSDAVNISIDDVNQNCTEKVNGIDISSIPNDQDIINIDGKIKIVRIEKNNQENQDKNQLTSFPQPYSLDGMDATMGMDNGSVLYVSPDVGNITINQDRNQIILIPIDYCKPHASTQCEMENRNNEIQVQDIVDIGDKTVDVNNGIIFEDVTAVSSSAEESTPSLSIPFTNTSTKKSHVDQNIVTEGTYLQNKELIYELESKVKPQLFQEITAPAVTVPEPPPAPPKLSTIIVSQIIEPDTRYRRILPRGTKPVEINPVVVIQPLVENNSVVMKRNKSSLHTKSSSSKKVHHSLAKNSSANAEKKKEVNADMPSIKTPVHENDPPDKESMEVNDDIVEVPVPVNSEKINEEKENVVTNEEKTETPVVVVSKNSKRLSLSTPRRRNHIRALEFETPPKTKGDKKKSKTSPKLRVDKVNLKNKNVRNTLFKSPDSDTVSKTPACLKSEKKNSANAVGCRLNETVESHVENRSDLSVTATVPNAKASDPWENMAGITVLSNSESKASKNSWDSDLRYFITSSNSNTTSNRSTVNEKKRIRKPKKNQKNDKKSTKKQFAPLPKSRVTQTVPSPTKMNLTAKRNTYSISGNEDGSPVRSLLEELDLVTPFKDSEPVRPTEETPLTKLFRENINGIDIDLSMINTPIFPPTPSIIITPEVEDTSGLTGTYYYSPLKEAEKEKIIKGECQKNELLKIDEIIRTDSEQLKKKGAKETHEKVIGELVSKAKEIVGLGTEGSEENAIKKPPSGKMLSMVKIQMITQCDKKLYENIPINEESNYDNLEQKTLIENVTEEMTKFDLKCELEEKRKRALKKIKTLKENLTTQARRKTVKRIAVKRRRDGKIVESGKKTKADSANESGVFEGKSNNSNESAGRVEILHSTPYKERRSTSAFERENSSETDRVLLDEIREEFPPFQDGDEFPELPLKTRKKLHFIRHFLKANDVVKFLEKDGKPVKLKLKRSHRKFFQVFYRWLKHPHSREVNISDKTKHMFREYLALFERIKRGVSYKSSEAETDKEDKEASGSEEILPFNEGSKNQSYDDDVDAKLKTSAKRKEDELDDGPVSTLPLKKRKATVQPVEMNEAESVRSSNEKTKSRENPSRTQNFLQDIDVDRFLSQIHGQENR